MYCLRKLKSFHVSSAIMKSFYTSTIESIICFGITCYGGNLSKQQASKLDRVIYKSSKIIGCPLPSFTKLLESSIARKASKIIKDKSHPLNSEYVTSERSGRLLSKAARTERFKNSFVPHSIRVLQLLS